MKYQLCTVQYNDNINSLLSVGWKLAKIAYETSAYIFLKSVA